MYYDLNVPWTGESATTTTLPKQLAALEKRIFRGFSIVKLLRIVGYKAVAINHKVEGKLPKTKCPFGRIKYSSQVTLAPLRQYSRLTLVISDLQQNNGINSGNEVVRSYDLLAVQPETERTFISACTSLEVDIISLDLSTRLSFPVKAGYLRQALSRGIVFEILYSPIISDSTARRNVIGGARSLIRLALHKGGSLLLSSGAESIWPLRAPLDVLNLGGLLGIPPHLRKNCLESTAESVVMHAATRLHTHRGAIALISEQILPLEKATTTPPTNFKPDHGDPPNNVVKSTTDLLEDFIAFH